MVALMKKHAGRGPTTARAFINDDVVTVVLEETLTEVERTLAGAGKADVVKNLRQSFQAAFCDEAVALIEQVMAAEVRAFMADHSVVPDVAVMCFVLAPTSAIDEDDPDPCEGQAIAASA